VAHSLDSSVSKRPRVSGGIEIARGAEGVISRASYLGRPAIRKERFSKRYRHPLLDKKLTSRRLAQEARVLLRLRKAGIPVPAVYSVDIASSTLVLEDLGGVTLRGFLSSSPDADALAIAYAAGSVVRRMHDAGIIHGDLTTSNMIVRGAHPEASESSRSVCLIDFGLSATSGTDEDRAVDLYVLERAVVSAHPERASFLNKAFFESYARSDGATSGSPVLAKLDEVRARGRKRDMTG
jgi:TP53 regulating kinase-like protein